jgi:thymidylate synthase (FAD)
MKLIQPSIEVMRGLENPQDVYEFIELCGRNCYKSEEKIDEFSAVKLIEKLIKRKHWTPFEFHDVTVRFICDRGISHELVRHRLCSFLQESSRYCDYGDGHICFVIPYFCDHVKPGTYDTAFVHNHGHCDEAETEWLNAMSVAEEYYKQLRDHNLAPQGARDVLPNSLKTEVICKANLREWMHIFKMRCSDKAHPDMAKLAKMVLKEFREALPLIFGRPIEWLDE